MRCDEHGQYGHCVYCCAEQISKLTTQVNTQESIIADLDEALECLIHRCDAEEVGTAWAPLTAARAAIAKARGAA